MGFGACATKLLAHKTFMDGDAGYRTPYLSHAKRALYHVSYIPICWLLQFNFILNSLRQTLGLEPRLLLIPQRDCQLFRNFSLRTSSLNVLNSCQNKEKDILNWIRWLIVFGGLEWEWAEHRLGGPLSPKKIMAWVTRLGPWIAHPIGLWTTIMIKREWENYG